MESKVFVIAEIGVNHNGDIGRARDLIEAAAESGAHAAKFQHFNAEALANQTASLAPYQIQGNGPSQTQRDWLKRFELSVDQQQELKSLCDKKNVEYMATAFDSGSLRTLLTKIGVSRLKIASGEITNGPFLLQHAIARLPLIISTGMSNLEEIRQALNIIEHGAVSDTSPAREVIESGVEEGQRRSDRRHSITLLQCTTAYPAPLESTNLRVMQKMREVFGCAVGFSDHTPGITAAVAATALGAAVIEKHLTLSCDDDGPDHKASIEPAQFKEMIQAINNTTMSLGDNRKTIDQSEIENQRVARKSLIAMQKIKKGQKFTKENLGVKRPGTGISPMFYWEFLGKVSKANYESGDLIVE